MRQTMVWAVALVMAGCGCAASAAAPADPVPRQAEPEGARHEAGPYTPVSDRADRAGPDLRVDAVLFDLWGQVWELSRLWLDCVAMAQEATELTGSRELVATGTLATDGRGEVSWDPEPSDRLVHVTPEGTHECRFVRLQGPALGPVAAFAAAPHHVEVRAVAGDGTMDLHFVSVSSAEEHDVWVEGALSWGGIAFEVNLAFNETEVSGRDPAGAYRDSFQLVVGTLKAGELIVSVDQTLGHQWTQETGGPYVDMRQREIDDVLRTPGGEHRIADAFSSTRAVDGFADLESWHVSGEVTRDGEVVGGLDILREGTDGAGTASVILQTPVRTFVLERHPLR